MRTVRWALCLSVIMTGCSTTHAPIAERDDPRPADDMVSPNAFSRALAHYSQGHLHQHARPPRLVEALRHFELAIREDPTHLESFLKTAELHYRMGNVDEAIAVMQSATLHHPKSYDAQVKLGSYAQIAGKPLLATRACEAAVALRPHEQMPYVRLAYLYMQRDLPDQSRRVLDLGLDQAEQDGEIVDAFDLVGDVLRAKGELVSAAQCYAIVAKNDPENLRIRTSLIRCYIDLDLMKEAESVLDALAGDTTLHPENYAVTLADLYKRVGNRTRAIHYLKSATSTGEIDANLYLQLAILYIQEEKNAEAVEVLTGIEKRIPASPFLYSLIGEVHERMADFESAERYYKTACDLPGATSITFQKLALLRVRAGKISAAIASLDDGVRAHPDDMDTLAMLGWLHYLGGEFKPALRVFERVEELDGPESFSVEWLDEMFYFWFGSACERDGQIPRSEKLFRKCIARHPDHHQAYNYLAYMWAERGTNLKEALGFVRRALKKEPDNPAYVDTLGWIYYKQDRPRKAHKALQRSFELMPDDATILDHLGDALFLLNRRHEAVKYWKNSFMLDPDNASIAGKLEQNGVDPNILRRQIHAAQGEARKP